MSRPTDSWIGILFFHDPAKAAERAAAQRAGGANNRASTLPADTPEFAVGTAVEVVSLLGETINQVRTGMLDPKVANCIGYLSGIVLKGLDQGDLQRRIEALENVVDHQRRKAAKVFDTDPECWFKEEGRDAVLKGEEL